jgi:hypothetical protein
MVNILEPQGFGKQSLLQGALDGAFDILPHGTELERVGVFPQDRFPRLAMPEAALT